jgi:hypothetical protein
LLLYFGRFSQFPPNRHIGLASAAAAAFESVEETRTAQALEYFGVNLDHMPAAVARKTRDLVTIEHGAAE